MDWSFISDRGTSFIDTAVAGLTIGGVYALVAVGYTMVYGIIGLINFAHGEIYMLGAFIALSLVLAGVPWFIALPLAIAACSILGILIDRVAYRPLRSAPRLAALITAIGVSLFLQNLALVIWGGEFRSFPRESLPGFLRETALKFALPGGSDYVHVTISWMQLVILFTAASLMVALHVVIHRTRLGMAMRAIAQDRKAAALMGINANTVVALTFAIGSAMGAVAGILVGILYEKVEPYMGYTIGIKAFAAAVLGGIGSVPGAVLGGLVLGLGESFGAFYLSSKYRDGIAYALLILVIVFKPSGLLGKPVKEKV